MLWFLSGDPQLSDVAKTTMERGGEVLLVSTASVWEIAIKKSSGKLTAPDDLTKQLREQRFDFLDISPDHAWQVHRLPIVPDHKDPFDRMLVAQAQWEELPIISADARLDVYAVRRHW